MKIVSGFIVAFVVFSIAVLAQDSRPRIVSRDGHHSKSYTHLEDQKTEKQKNTVSIPAPARAERGAKTPPLPPAIFDRHPLENPEDTSPYDDYTGSGDDFNHGLYTSGIFSAPLFPSLRDMGVGKVAVSPPLSLGLIWQKEPPSPNCMNNCFDAWSAKSEDGRYRAVIAEDPKGYICIMAFPSGYNFTTSGSFSHTNTIILKKEKGNWVVQSDEQAVLRGEQFISSANEHFFRQYFAGLIQQNCGLPDTVVEAILATYSQ